VTACPAITEFPDQQTFRTNKAVLLFHAGTRARVGKASVTPMVIATTVLSCENKSWHLVRLLGWLQAKSRMPLNHVCHWR
jgi:hypothetical protein